MKPDKTFLSVLVTLLILSAIFFVIERIAGRGRNRQQPVFRRGWLTDVIYWFTTILLTKPFVRFQVRWEGRSGDFQGEATLLSP